MADAVVRPVWALRSRIPRRLPTRLKPATPRGRAKTASGRSPSRLVATSNGLPVLLVAPCWHAVAHHPGEASRTVVQSCPTRTSLPPVQVGSAFAS